MEIEEVEEVKEVKDKRKEERQAIFRLPLFCFYKFFAGKAASSRRTPNYRDAANYFLLYQSALTGV